MNRWARVTKEVLEETVVEGKDGCYQDTLRRRVRSAENRLATLERELKGAANGLALLSNALGYQLTYTPGTPEEWKFIPRTTTLTQEVKK